MSNAHVDRHPDDIEPKSKSHLTRRGKAAALLATGVAGYLLHPVIEDAAHGVEHVVHAASSNVHQAGEYDHYSERNLYEKMHEAGGFDSGKVLIYTVGPEDTPQQIAVNVGAKDIRLVGDEISGQEGGAGNLQVGDEVVIPKDQLNMPK